MTKFKLYQIHLTDAEVDKINAEGHDSVHKQSLKLDMGHSNSRISFIAKEAFDLGYYTHVSNISAEGLEGVFHVGNMGPESQIERLGDMYSVSVSDIVIDETGKKSVVADIGFKEVA